MNIEEIRKNAPLGATHYKFDTFNCLRYLKITKDQSFMWCDYDSGENRWRKISYHNFENLDLDIELKPLH